MAATADAERAARERVAAIPAIRADFLVVAAAAVRPRLPVATRTPRAATGGTAVSVAVLEALQARRLRL